METTEMTNVRMSHFLELGDWEWDHSPVEDEVYVHTLEEAKVIRDAIAELDAGEGIPHHVFDSKMQDILRQ
ncbi:MAG: hypothetical protein ACRC10_00830 [Thermoguttaceae bacterium]